MNKIAFFLLVLLSFTNQSSYSQNVQYKTYTNSKDKFSFDVPNYWEVKFSKTEFGFIGAPVTSAEIKIYKDCFEGIVFRMFIYNTSLDATLTNDGYKKTGNNYFTSDKLSNNVKADNIKGKNWTGIYHRNTCGINCKVNGVQKVDGTCEFIYFSNGKTTVSLTTNGKEFKKEVLEKLKSSFHFN